jgi:acyl carrier protein
LETASTEAIGGRAPREVNPSCPVIRSCTKAGALLSPSEGAPPLNPKGAVIRRARRGVRGQLEQLYGAAQEATAQPPDSPLLRRLQSLPIDLARTELAQLVRSIVAEVRGSDVAVDPSRGFAEQGFDSLMAVRTQGKLQAALGVTLPATLLFDAPTVDRLVECLAIDLLGCEARSEPPSPSRASADEPIAIIGAACRLPRGIEI